MMLFSLSEHTIDTGFEKYLNDFQTPKNVCEYMASLIPAETKTVLEPTPGAGNLVGVLSRYKVTAPNDFFLLKKKRYDAIVMNPPFSSKYANMKNAPAGIGVNGMKVGYYILKECMKMTDHVIALMPWFTLSDSDVRLREFNKFGIESITLLPRKTFQYARIQTIVIHLHKGYKGQSLFKIMQ